MYNRVKIDEKQTFVFAMNYEGLVPGLLVYLLKSRDRRKEMMNNATTPFERMIHNGAQLALKVSANSVYGFTGVPPEKSLLPCMPIAKSTCASGRRGTYLSRDYAEDMNNFRDVMQCTTHFPLYYMYLVKNVAKNKFFHLNAEKLLDAHRVCLSKELPIIEPDDKNQIPWQYLPEHEPTDEINPVICVKDLGLQVWTTEEFAKITGFSRVKRPYIEGDLIRVHTDKGTTLDMNERHFVATTDGKKPVNDFICKVVYGDTDSIFCLIGSRHLRTQSQKVAYCGIVCALISHRITGYLHSLNPFREPKDQWMNLEYEKAYRYWILFSKKRYIGEMTEFNPYRFTDDEKGVAKKRRDFCPFVKENYSKISKAIFDNDQTVSRSQRIENALAVVRKAVEDLLNNRVPFEKLVISKLLKDHYKAREKKQTKSKGKKSGASSFGPHNIFANDLITWKQDGCICKGIIEVKRVVTVDAFLKGKTSHAMENNAREGPPLTARIMTVVAGRVGVLIPATLTVNVRQQLNYGDIILRDASVVHLDKILDPKTTDKELEPITNPHVRLARRMYMRDSATAPKSGIRVPYVFCEPENQSVLQYLRAENPLYAKTHGMKVDPVYYLKKQCSNAWGQILETTCPGVVTEIFDQAYDLYAKRTSGQVELRAFIEGTHTENRKRIKLSSTDEAVARAPRVVAPAGLKVVKAKKGTLQKGQSTLGKYFIAPLRSETVAAKEPIKLTAPKKIPVKQNIIKKRDRESEPGLPPPPKK